LIAFPGFGYYGSVGAVDEALAQVIGVLERLLGYSVCQITRT
jgi:ethanolamine utilization microcompartment shell protein EutS